jgi:hypothetical protein
MRQAIVIKNPKWELFTAASDAFKKLKAGETAVLVVRGRCKEIKPPKLIAKAVKVAAVLLLCALPSFAQQNLVNNLATSTLAGSTTNATAGQGFIGWNIDQVAVVQLSVVGTNAATTGTVTVLLDTSDNGSDWLAAQYTTATVTCNGTTTATGISRITNSVGGKYLRIGGYKNLNDATNAVTVQRFTISLEGS